MEEDGALAIEIEVGVSMANFPQRGFATHLTHTRTPESCFMFGERPTKEE